MNAYPASGDGQLAVSVGESPIPSLAELGLERTNLEELNLGKRMSKARASLDDFLPRLVRYEQAQNFPAIKGLFYLSLHLRFGRLSIRVLVRLALDAMRAGHAATGAVARLSELI